MQTNSYNNIIVEILVSSRFKFVRHLLLFICVLFISAGNVWYAIEHGIVFTPFVKYGVLLLSTGVALTGCYFNIYVLTPKLLLKNRWGRYFLFLLGVALLLLITLLVLAVYGETAPVNLNTDNIGYFHLFKGIINLSSSTLGFFVLLAGTSTFVLFKNWILDMRQSEELESNTLQMELKLLENQINPHFLFNMLNSANILVKKDPDVAVHIIGKLEEMLRYLMNDSIQEKVYLKDEIVFLNDFLELEKTRRDYFDYAVSGEGESEHVQTAPLLFIPFVENAVKHNQDSRASSYVNISFKIEKEKLIFICENSIPQRSPDKKGVGGIGLHNVKRRLDLLYKGNYSLENTKTDTNYTVKLELKL